MGKELEIYRDLYGRYKKYKLEDSEEKAALKLISDLQDLFIEELEKEKKAEEYFSTSWNLPGVKK
jgi:hypothetical protein